MSERQRRLEGWGTEDRELSWWRRGYDPIGRHTMVATVLGVLIAALIGATADPFNLRTADDLRRAEATAYEIAFSDIQEEGYAAGVPFGEVQHLGSQIVEQGAGGDSSYGQHFRIGWTEGWNDALTAMREAAVTEGLPEGYTEFRVLDSLPRR
ncbi:MAG: hypothetical protein OXI41_15120 [Chloroflexota bacterium]|nr:hypothetical protein [Chloroflexota bacterium]MDE2894258.1 hypothetical protein [Chloroflexota bacterium]